MYLLLPTEEKFWLNPAVDRLRGEKNEMAQKSLLLLLWYAQRSEADQAIRATANDASRSTDVRNYAAGLMARRVKRPCKCRANAHV